MESVKKKTEKNVNSAVVQFKLLISFCLFQSQQTNLQFYIVDSTFESCRFHTRRFCASFLLFALKKHSRPHPPRVLALNSPTPFRQRANLAQSRGHARKKSIFCENTHTCMYIQMQQRLNSCNVYTSCGGAV